MCTFEAVRGLGSIILIVCTPFLFVSGVAAQSLGDNVGVFESGIFYLDQDSSNNWTDSDAFFQFGLRGDKPVAGDWNSDGFD